MTKAEAEKQLEKILESNEDLQKIFEEHPERRELYLEKMIDSEEAKPGCAKINPHFCRSCYFANGAAPFADSPEKVYCAIYNRENTNGKPPDVYYEGAECEYYEKG